LLGGAAAVWPLAARAQRPAKVVGVLNLGPASAWSSRVAALRAGLRDLGWVDWNPTTPSHAPALRAIEDASDKLRVRLLLLPAPSANDFDGAFAAMVQERADAFLVVPSPLSTSYRSALAELALKHRLPAMYGHRDYVEAGGLMSYGADIDDLNRRTALYIDKILKGAKPADLPVEQASKYQLAINLKVAKALGLEIPPTLLARADEVIE
jgi:putative ABC transport system substrate-binding protein